MGSRGSSSGSTKEPTSYRGPAEFGEQFAKLNPKLSPEKVADMAVNRWSDNEMPLVDDDDMNSVYEAAYLVAARKAGYTPLKINNALNKAFGTDSVVYEKF